jgi:hypothetical protein
VSFVFRLARELKLTLGQVLAMPAEEFDWWRTIYGMEPWAEEKAEVYGALTCHTTAAPWSRSNTRLTDWMVKWDVDPELEALKMQARCIMIAAEARYARRQKEKDSGR